MGNVSRETLLLFAGSLTACRPMVEYGTRLGGAMGYVSFELRDRGQAVASRNASVSRKANQPHLAEFPLSRSNE